MTATHEKRLQTASRFAVTRRADTQFERGLPVEPTAAHRTPEQLEASAAASRYMAEVRHREALDRVRQLQHEVQQVRRRHGWSSWD